MRVGVFTYSTKPRGSVAHALSLCEGLRTCAERGEAEPALEVSLFALSKRGDRLYRPAACPVRYLEAGEAPGDVDALIRQRIAEVVEGLRLARPALDVWHAQDCLVASALLEARRRWPTWLSGVIVRTVHHVDRFDSPYLSACQKRSIEEADVVLSVSAATQLEVLSEFGRTSHRVGSGVDVARFAPRAAPGSGATRQSSERSERDFAILSVGGVEPRKNSLKALEAVALVAQRSPRVRWVVVGGASIHDHSRYRARFLEALSRLPEPVRERVRVTGPVSERELVEHYRASDALLCASTHEGFGLCVLEALAAGLPVVASNRPPFTEYLSAETAELCDPEDARAIAVALDRLRQRPEHAAELAARGRRLCDRHSWRASARRHRDLYAAALRARRSGSAESHSGRAERRLGAIAPSHDADPLRAEPSGEVAPCPR